MNLDDIVRNIKEFARQNKVPVIHDNTASLLEILIKASGTATILEIGTAIGYSAIIMTRALPEEGRLDTIEVNPDMVDTAWKNIREAGMGNKIRILEGDAGDILPSLTGQYDMIFLDAAKSRYVEFLPQCIRLVRKNGLIAADNVLYKGLTMGSEHVRHKQRTAVTRLREFLRVLEKEPQLKTVLIPIEDGVTISVKE